MPAPAEVIDLARYRQRKLGLTGMPVAWVMVWFAPVVFVRPFPNFG
jgi:hypothetical protein